MNKIVIATIAAAVLSATTAVYAGGGCCAAKHGDAAAMKSGQKAACGAFLSKLNLTDEQKAKIDALHKECQEAGCSADAHTKFMEGLKGILTAEQLAQCKASCGPAKGCAAAKTAEK